MDEITRGEFALLTQIVNQTQVRVENLDSSGTKGVAVVTAQLVDVIKDLTELKIDVTKRFDEHDIVHKQEMRDRVSGHRWMIGISVAGLSSLAAILTVVVEILMHIN